MVFICPHCGNNSFSIATEHVGASHAACLRCGEITPFAAEEMIAVPKTKRRWAAPAGPSAVQAVAPRTGRQRSEPARRRCP
jgi:hypothetical protein